MKLYHIDMKAYYTRFLAAVSHNVCLVADKPSSSSGSSSKRSYLKGIFSDKKVDPKDTDKDKSQDYECM